MFFRAVSCIGLSAKEGVCENCLHEQKLCFKKIKQREIYKSTVQEEPLSRISLNALDGRILSTLQSNRKKYTQLTSFYWVPVQHTVYNLCLKSSYNLADILCSFRRS